MCPPLQTSFHGSVELLLGLQRSFWRPVSIWLTATCTAQRTPPHHLLSSLQLQSLPPSFSTTQLQMKTLLTWISCGLPPCISTPPTPLHRWSLLHSNFWWAWVILSSQEHVRSTNPGPSTRDWLTSLTWPPRLSRMLTQHVHRRSRTLLFAEDTEAR